MIFRIASIALSCLLVTSCTFPPPKPWIKRYGVEIDCGIEIKKKLRDPDSYQLISLHYDKEGEDPETGSVLVAFRAKNGFGGYTEGLATCERSRQGADYAVNANLIVE